MKIKNAVINLTNKNLAFGKRMRNGHEGWPINLTGNTKPLSISVGTGILLREHQTSFLIYIALVIAAECVCWQSNVLLVLAPECTCPLYCIACLSYRCYTHPAVGSPSQQILKVCRLKSCACAGLPKCMLNLSCISWISLMGSKCIQKLSVSMCSKTGASTNLACCHDTQRFTFRSTYLAQA